MPTQDIQMWRDEGAIVFNGPDEQLISGLGRNTEGLLPEPEAVRFARVALPVFCSP